MSQDLVTLLQQLVRIPSVNPDNTPGTSETGEETLAVFLSGWLESIGADVTLEEIKADQTEVPRGPSVEKSETRERPQRS